MPSSHHAKPENHTDATEGTLQRLRQAALRVAGRGKPPRAERALIKMITAAQSSSTFRQQESQHHSDTPPAEIVEALRSPAGTQRLVVTYVEGRRLRAVINPIGRPDPEREAAVWRCLRDLAKEHAA